MNLYWQWVEWLSSRTVGKSNTYSNNDVLAGIGVSSLNSIAPQLGLTDKKTSAGWRKTSTGFQWRLWTATVQRLYGSYYGLSLSACPNQLIVARPCFAWKAFCMHVPLQYFYCAVVLLLTYRTGYVGTHLHECTPYWVAYDHHACASSAPHKLYDDHAPLPPHQQSHHPNIVHRYVHGYEYTSKIWGTVYKVWW